MDKVKLNREILAFFISHEYRRGLTILTQKAFDESEQKATERYQNDTMFNARVNHMFNAVLRIISLCED